MKGRAFRAITFGVLPALLALVAEADGVTEPALRGAAHAQDQNQESFVNMTLQLKAEALGHAPCSNKCYVGFGFEDGDCECVTRPSWWMWVCNRRQGETIESQYCGGNNCTGCSGPLADPPAPSPPQPLPEPPAAAPAPPIPTVGPPTPAPPTVGPPAYQEFYKLDWVAQGTSFFDGFDFDTFDGNHGAAEFLASHGEGDQAHVSKAYRTHAILRAGGRSDQYKFKRQTAKIKTKKTWTHFLATMRYSHLPFGCGVWPAFFTLAPSMAWPAGGEIDILEYVNDQDAKASFHLDKACSLDPNEVNRYKAMEDGNKVVNKVDYNCQTKYCADCTSIGCAPNVYPLKNGQGWSETPGVIALETTPEHIKIFHIPEWAIPGDLKSDTPRPEDWNQWLISYFPFAASERARPGSCPDAENILAPQQLVLGINFCGDWASKVWGSSHTCGNYGSKKCRSVDPLAEYAPEEDCCTQFIYDEEDSYGTDSYLKSRAFFNISSLKVYQLSF